MIANPALRAFRYNPYDKSLTREHYETQKMLQLRRYKYFFPPILCVSVQQKKNDFSPCSLYVCLAPGYVSMRLRRCCSSAGTNTFFPLFFVCLAGWLSVGRLIFSFHGSMSLAALRRTKPTDSEAVEAGRRAQRWGVILGTLGRQVRERNERWMDQCKTERTKGPAG